jgi:hypothetical protein
MKYCINFYSNSEDELNLQISLDIRLHEPERWRVIALLTIKIHPIENKNTEGADPSVKCMNNYL